MLDEGDHIVEKQQNEMENFIPHLKNWARDEVAKAQRSGDFAEIREKARTLYKSKTKVFDKADNLFVVVQRDADEPALKKKAAQKKQNVADIQQEYDSRCEEEVNQEIYAAETSKEANAEDLLKIYHEFSVKAERLIKKDATIKSNGIDRRPGVPTGPAEQRLVSLTRLVKSNMQTDCALRQQLHIELDETFTSENMP